MKVKTLLVDVSDPSCIGMFDAGVNRYLEAGYTLVKRMPLSDTRVYAELVKEDEDPEEAQMDDLIGAMQTIRCECGKHEHCTDCPIHENCDFSPPPEWLLPKEDEDE